jgi:hypothetical protein
VGWQASQNLSYQILFGPGRIGVIHLEHAVCLNTADTVGATVEASAQYHHLGRPLANGITQGVVDVSRSRHT